MKTLKPLIGMLLPLWLAACTTPAPQPPVLQSDWQQQQSKLSQLDHWNMSGRLSVQTESDGGQADFSWQQQGPQHYMIRLVAPMGAGTTWIQGEPDGVSLRTSAGGEAFDEDVDKLIQQLQGWPIPVSGLYYWVRGLPAKSSPHVVRKWHKGGLPEVLEQDGWRIEFRGYKRIAGKLLPKKLFISRLDEQEVDVRLIVRQWGIE